MGYEKGKSLYEILEERFESLEERINEISEAVKRLEKLMEGVFEIRCPNCGSFISTWPIPYFMVKAIHGADASPLETRGIGVKRGLYGPQTDWLEHVIKCKKCGYEYHIIYW